MPQIRAGKALPEMSNRGQKKKSTRPVLSVGDPRGMGFLIARFEEWLQVKGYSEVTIYTHRKSLEYFARWCEERGVTRPSEVTRPILERYQRFLFNYRKADGQPLTFRSQRARLTPLRAIFRWLTRNNFLPSNPAADIDLPKEEQRLPRGALTVEEVERIISQVDLSEPRGIRDRAILETFYSTGMRRKEVIRLKLGDVDMKWGIVVVREGKGRKDRIIPIGERAVAWINKYLAEVRLSYAVEPDEGYLFLTREGNDFTLTGMGSLVRRYVRAAEIGKRGSCHLFRHTMATLMLEGGAGLRYIQRMLGHAQLSTTEVYTQVSTRKLKEVFMATHPGAKLRRDTDMGREAVEAGLIGDEDEALGSPNRGRKSRYHPLAQKKKDL